VNKALDNTKQTFKTNLYTLTNECSKITTFEDGRLLQKGMMANLFWHFYFYMGTNYRCAESDFFSLLLCSFV